MLYLQECGDYSINRLDNSAIFNILFNLNIKRTGLVCIDTSCVVPVSNLYRHVLKVLAEASYLRRTIWVKAKMSGLYILLAFQYWLR